MEIVVCIKQVPDPAHLKFDPVTGCLTREGTPGIINPLDKHALEAGLQLSERHGGRVTVVSMGPAAARDSLLEALAMGASRAFLASDKAFAGSDTLATAAVLAALIRQLGHFDLILGGYKTVDSGTAQVGPQLASALGIPFFTRVQKIELRAGKLQLEISRDDLKLLTEADLPALVTVARESNKPRGMRLSEVKKARSRRLEILDAAALSLPAEAVGAAGSRLYLSETLPLPAGKEAQLISGEPEEAARQACAIIQMHGFCSREG